MNAAQLLLARRRLRLGISNVGFWVVCAGAGLLWLKGQPALGSGQLAGIFLAVLALQSAFDWAGGFWLMPEPRPGAREFLARWLRAVCAHTLVLAGIGALSLLSFHFTGSFVLAMWVSMATLAVGRVRLLGWMAGVLIERRTHDGEALLVVHSSDPAFTGAPLGLDRTNDSLWPARWLAELPKSDFAAEASRRRWQLKNRLPTWDFALVGLWNMAGATMGAWALDLPHLLPSAALLSHVCWMTLWTFLSLLVLPILSRSAVFAADRGAADAGVDPRRWIEGFPALVSEDGHPGALMQGIFYPVPSAGRRLARLEEGAGAPGLVLGNLARNNLFYSWAGLTLLGRAVHCNVGRPALWVFAPSA